MRPPLTWPRVCVCFGRVGPPSWADRGFPLRSADHGRRRCVRGREGRGGCRRGDRPAQTPATGLLETAQCDKAVTFRLP